MTLYIIRHADPDYVRDSITEAGKKEAASLSERLEREGIDELYSSPLGRARETAGYTARALSKEVTILPWTREISDAAVDIDGFGRIAAWDAPAELVLEDEDELEANGWTETRWTRQVGLKRHYEHIARSADVFLFEQG